MSVSLANVCWHLGQMQAVSVKSLTILSLKHFTNVPLPPLRYLKSNVLH